MVVVDQMQTTGYKAGTFVSASPAPHLTNEDGTVILVTGILNNGFVPIVDVEPSTNWNLKNTVFPMVLYLQLKVPLPNVILVSVGVQLVQAPSDRLAIV